MYLRQSYPASKPNNSFKPNLLRYNKIVAEKACHDFASTTQVGLTQAFLLGEEMAHLHCAKVSAAFPGLVVSTALATRNLVAVRRG